jgi:hypothetical protein
VKEEPRIAAFWRISQSGFMHSFSANRSSLLLACNYIEDEIGKLNRFFSQINWKC